MSPGKSFGRSEAAKAAIRCVKHNLVSLTFLSVLALSHHRINALLNYSTATFHENKTRLSREEARDSLQKQLPEKPKGRKASSSKQYFKSSIIIYCYLYICLNEYINNVKK